MKALVFHGANDIRVASVDQPGTLGPSEVLVRPELCGICGTDLHEYTDGPIVIPTSPHPLTGASLPQILGHELSATVVATGPDVDHLRVGDLCTVMPLISCGTCDLCVRGKNHLCRTMACTGLSSQWGGLAELAVVAARQLVLVPEGVSALQAALIEPAAVAAYGVDRGGVRPGATVFVTGAGPIGSLVIMYALASGALRVVISETDEVRLARVAALGVGLGEVVAINPARDSVRDLVDELTGGTGADVAIECAGQEAALNSCIGVVRPAGTVVQTALHVRPAAISADLLAAKDISLIGTWCYPVYDFPRIAGLVAGGRLPVERVVTSKVGLESALASGFDRLLARGSGEVKVLVEVAA
jgi:(R,R)-butanediol dehydrogenase/meso-butanediol dehydrogenase/diacetyl reductase